MTKPNKSLNKNLKSTLNQILTLAKSIELGSQQTVSAELIFEILELFEDLKNFSDFEAQKIYNLKIHFKPEMPMKSFVNFIVPIERFCNKSVSDDHFLVTAKDRSVATNTKQNLVFILENIRSAFNLGSIIRLSDCLNIQEIALSGYTANLNHPDVIKTSLGSYENVKSQHFKNTEEAITLFRNLDYKIYAVETAEKAKNLFDFNFSLQKIAFVFGNERFGLDFKTIDLCDDLIKIPTLGIKNSMNIANAVSVIGYEFYRQNQEQI